MGGGGVGKRGGNDYGKVMGVGATVTRGWVTDVELTQHRWLQCIFPVSCGFLRADGEKGTVLAGSEGEASEFENGMAIAMLQ